MLIEGEADVAAIDDTIWEHRRGIDPRLQQLFVVERTQSWPAPPLSVSRLLESELRMHLVETLLASRPCGLDSVVAASSEDYDCIRRAMATG
jgi:ABC-type phosphate/phosphonate transport system substrate-binding protein